MGDGDMDSEEEALEMRRRQRKLVKREKKLREESKLEKILKKEEKVKRKLQKREKEKLKSRLGSVITARSVDMSSIVRVEDQRQEKHLPSASDYSDLESPDEREMAPHVLSVVSRPPPQSRTSRDEERKKRLMQRIVEREEDRSRKKRREEKQTYAAKVLGSLVNARDVDMRKRLGHRVKDREDRKGREQGVEEVEVLQLEQRKSEVKEKRGGEDLYSKGRNAKRKLEETDEDELKAKTRKGSLNDSVRSDVSIKTRRIKPPTKQEFLSNVQDVLETSQGSFPGLDTSQEGDIREGDIEGDVMKELDDFINE